MFDSNQFFGGGAGDFYPVSIEQSLRFNDDDSAYLSRTPASAGNRKTWTWSGWVKLSGAISGNTALFVGGSSGSNFCSIALDGNSNISLFWYVSSSVVANVTTSAKLRDPSAWYHLQIAVDTTQATASNRMIVYLNGIQQTSFVSTTYPTQNYDGLINNTNAHYLGQFASAGYNYFDGYLAEVHFCDGESYTADAFGELKSGVWVAKAPSVDYGTNGFYLDFANSADIGNDVSGEGNDWTPNNFTASDVVLDSPTDNFATLNPLDAGTASVFADGNLKYSHSSNAWSGTKSTFAVSSGKWYFEATLSFTTQSASNIGICLSTNTANTDGNTSGSYIYSSDGTTYFNGSSSTGNASYTNGDTIGVAFDMDAGTLTFYKNGSVQPTTASSLSGEFTPFVSLYYGSDTAWTANFGQLGFTYTPPTDYLALSTANLPEPTISPADDASPEDYFGIDTYTGNGGTIDSDFGFDCDLVWYKNRGRANTFHYLFDQVRGDDLPLYSNDTFAEDSQFPTYHTQSFITGGSRIVRTLGDHLNFSGDSYVAWAWKANGSGVSNTVGSIPSMVSANTTSGFSIVTYTGNNTNGATVGHGLGVTPDMLIIKARLATTGWSVNHVGTGMTSGYLQLQSTAAFASAANNITGISSSTFTLGTDSWVNASGQPFICYAFHSVEGFSKFGSYTGNDSGDGNFIYTGFAPALIVIKYVSGSAGGTKNWYVWDNARSPQNVNDNILYWNEPSSEGGDSAFDIDRLSNGFKLRNAEGGVNNAAEYIYMAWAETPFKYGTGV